ncbi:fur family transcriptional regulator FurA3 [Arthrobacter tumbae]|uniref:Fur family transcriptional regulator n=1 Tax=Arthrobacter tumbae TaxID=163874 RepID=UPI0019570924|nr:Fur family transcriptional regulator [Arthrobacter tumbae]MBM7781740.1 Fur family ferric uptake transcriptional regulator [Arthrobacter tumbae]
MAKATVERNEDLVRIIRAAGLKVTAPRLAVLEALQQAPHSSAEHLFLNVRPALPGTSAQAVYGVLAAFTEAGLVRRFDPPGTAALFECRVGDNHHHLLCIRCGKVTDVDCVVGAAPCLSPSDSAGFAVLSAEVTFNGICPQCRNAV